MAAQSVKKPRLQERKSSSKSNRSSYGAGTPDCTPRSPQQSEVEQKISSRRSPRSIPKIRLPDRPSNVSTPSMRAAKSQNTNDGDVAERKQGTKQANVRQFARVSERRQCWDEALEAHRNQWGATENHNVPRIKIKVNYAKAEDVPQASRKRCPVCYSNNKTMNKVITLEPTKNELSGDVYFCNCKNNKHLYLSVVHKGCNAVLEKVKDNLAACKECQELFEFITPYALVWW